MRNLVLVACVAALGCHPSAGSVPAAALAPITATVTDSIVRRAAERFMASPRSVGVSVGVYHRGAFHTYGFGVTDLATRTPATARTLYPIASLTKTITGVLLARAQTDGRLRLEDDVRRYLDGTYPNLEFRGRPIALSYLISHVSRLPRSLPDVPPGPPGAAEPAYTRDEFYRDLARVTLDTFPGVKFGYSNAAAQLAGFVLERVYGLPYDALVDSLVARPLGMTETRITLSPELRARMATGYDEAHRVMPSPPEALQGAGALRSSVADMLPYVRWQVREADEVVRLSHRPVWGDTAAWRAGAAGYAVGLNWQMLRSARGVRKIFQDGNLPGYSALCVLYPELDLGIVVLSNQLDPTTPGRVSALSDSIAVALDGRAASGP